MSNDRQHTEIEIAFIQHRSRLREAAQAIVGTRDAAEDVTQSAYVKVVELSTEMVVRQPVSYCFQVVRHLAIDFRRRRQLESHLLADDSQGQTAVSGLGTPEQTLIHRQQILLVEKALSGLPPRTRKAFTLYRLSGLTQREIARQLGVSPTLVNFMIRDAIDALKRCRM